MSSEFFKIFKVFLKFDILCPYGRLGPLPVHNHYIYNGIYITAPRVPAADVFPCGKTQEKTAFSITPPPIHFSPS